MHVSLLFHHLCGNVVGLAGVVWFFAWLLLAFDTPASHPRISSEEQNYIESTIKAEILLKKSPLKVVPIYILTVCDSIWIYVHRIHQFHGKQFSHHFHFLVLYLHTFLECGHSTHFSLACLHFWTKHYVLTLKRLVVHLNSLE